MKLFYKIIVILGSVVFVIIMAFILLLTYKMPLNNYYLMIFQNDFRQRIRPLHPTKSISITEVAEVGNWTDGTKCQFIVGEFRTSSLSKEELEKIYPYNFFTAGVYFPDGNEKFGSLWYEWKERYLKNYQPKENEIVYLVWATDEDGSPDGDVRCD
ncbi:MAG: hypothetical protein AAB509_01240 [Patescibacteria group bacterium]